MDVLPPSLASFKGGIERVQGLRCTCHPSTVHVGCLKSSQAEQRQLRRPCPLDLFSLADVRAVELREDVVGQAKVPLARRVVVVLVQPDLGAVLGLVAVDVEVHLGVGDGGDPATISVSDARSPRWETQIGRYRTSIGRCRSSAG